MTTIARRCAGCSGPLPELPAGETQVKCGFCGLVNEVESAPPAVTIHVNQPTPRGGGRGLGLLVFVVILIAGGGAVAGIVVATRSAMMVNDAVQRVTGAVSRSVSSGAAFRRSVKPSEIREDFNAGWRTLDVPAPPSGFAAFDPVADLAWAQGIASQWQPDALLTRIDVAKLTAAGTVDAQGPEDSQAGYRFRSPAQEAAWIRAATNGDRDPHVGVELMMTVASGKITALVTHSRPDDSRRAEKAVAVESLRPQALLKAATGTRGFAAMPLYDGYMIFNRSEGWVWHLRGLGAQATFPRVRARDGAVWPYR